MTSTFVQHYIVCALISVWWGKYLQETTTDPVSPLKSWSVQRHAGELGENYVQLFTNATAWPCSACLENILFKWKGYKGDKWTLYNIAKALRWGKYIYKKPPTDLIPPLKTWSPRRDAGQLEWELLHPCTKCNNTATFCMFGNLIDANLKINNEFKKEARYSWKTSCY